MQDEESLTPVERELASTLGELRPAGASIDRDRLMFQAGQVSARRRGRLWQGATGLFALALAVSLVARPAPREMERIVAVTQGPRASETRGLASVDAGRWRPDPRPMQTNYLRLRHAVLTYGIDALPSPHVSPAKANERPESLEEWFGIPQGMLNRSGLLGVRGQGNQGERL